MSESPKCPFCGAPYTNGYIGPGGIQFDCATVDDGDETFQSDRCQANEARNLLRRVLTWNPVDGDGGNVFDKI